MNDWACSACHTTNSASASRCAVCGSAAWPVAGADAPTLPAVPVVSVERSQAPTEPAVAASAVPPPLAVPAGPAPSGPPGHRRSMGPWVALVAVAAVVVGAVAGVLVAGGRGPGAADDASQVSTVARDRPADEPDDRAPPSTSAALVEPDAAPEPEPNPEPLPTTVPASPAPTAPPAPSPPADQNYPAAVTFADPAHEANIALPEGMEVVSDYEPGSGQPGVWSGWGFDLRYEVWPSYTQQQVRAHERRLIEGAHGAIYVARRCTLKAGRPDLDLEYLTTDDCDSPETLLNWQQDGRYVVSGELPDGSYFYERGKLRCGDLVFYRFEWTGQAKNHAQAAMVDRLYNDSPALDAIGGVRPHC